MTLPRYGDMTRILLVRAESRASGVNAPDPNSSMILIPAGTYLLIGGAHPPEAHYRNPNEAFHS
jgi:hypothetical protein